MSKTVCEREQGDGIRGKGEETGRCTPWTSNGAPADARAPARGLSSSAGRRQPGDGAPGRQSPAATGETPSHHTLGDGLSSHKGAPKPNREGEQK